MDNTDTNYQRPLIVETFGKISEGYGLRHRFVSDDGDYGRTIGVEEALKWGLENDDQFNETEFEFVKAAFAQFSDETPPSARIADCCHQILKLVEGEDNNPVQ